MEILRIQGGRPLKGEVQIRGSKNTASKMMIASLLTADPCIIENVPLSAETDITRELCEHIGSRAEVTKARVCRMETPEIKNARLTELTRKNRIPILALGPLLHRQGFAEVPVPGGCPIGHRPINFHMEALKSMGAQVERRPNSYFVQAREIRGANINFPFPSVGATENVMLAAVLAQGRTVIHNAAVEPEILCLIGMLKSMGADIAQDEAGRAIEIQGVEKLHGASVRVAPDRNEAVSFAIAALATQGDIFVRGAEEKNLASFLEKIKEAGGAYEVKTEGIRFWGNGAYRAINIETSPHPGFMTDWQQPFSVLLTQGRGESIIHETVYEDRFGYAQDLNRMGARIGVSGVCPEGSACRFRGQGASHTASVSGPTKLQGREIVMTDIRAGMAHIIAALAAEGESVISGVEHIDRGYEKIDERLRQLGADIKRA